MIFTSIALLYMLKTSIVAARIRPKDRFHYSFIVMHLQKNDFSSKTQYLNIQRDVYQTIYDLQSWLLSTANRNKLLIEAIWEKNNDDGTNDPVGVLNNE
jgi:hypothetical protein